MVDLQDYKSSFNSLNFGDLFFDTIIHDLKNPLLAQISSLKLLNKGSFGKLNDNQQAIVEEIIKSSEYMKEILYNVLAQCRINHGTLNLNNQNFDVEEAAITVINSFKNFAAEKNVKIQFNSRLSDNEKLFCGDEIQLRRVFENMLNNAINYSYENTSVIVKTLKEDNNLIFSVENDGTPIEENIRKFIFDKFVKSQNSLGSGLGLYFCKKIIEAYGGTIIVSSKKRTNIFTLQIPCSK